MNRTRLSLPIFVVILAAAIAVIVSISGGKTKAQPAVAVGSAISLRQSSVGKVLTDANGRALYLFAGDSRNASRLSAAGLAVWPPFTSTTLPRATGGVTAARIGTATGAGGATQITYNGHPLYYYVGDHQPGQVLGQGLNQFGARWYVLSAAGGAITSAPKSAPAPASGASSSSYGY
jgi:predicted lipoprotein with Yx(FWY)xxD motif